MGDVQEFDVELRAHREFERHYRMRRLCGLADYDGVAWAMYKASGSLMLIRGRICECGTNFGLVTHIMYILTPTSRWG